MKRLLLGIVLALLLTSTLAVALNVQPVRVEGTIYIRADGSIDPSDAPISTADNVTYTLTGNITTDADGIIVERSSIVVDGLGYVLQGSLNGNGFRLSNVTGAIIRNAKIVGFNLGITIGWADNNITLTDNVITDNNLGIYINSAWNNTIENNVITYSHLEGVGIVHAYDKPGNVVESNLIANNDFAGIYIFDTTMNTIVMNNTVMNNLDGIFLDDARGFGDPGNNLIVHNIVMNNTFGIKSELSEGNKIYDNNLIDNTVQAQSDVTCNAWDDGYKGNYWSDYQTEYPNATQAGDTWDTPYVINASNSDNHPLAYQSIIPEFPSFLILPLFFVATLLAIIVYKRKHAKISGTP